MGRHRSPNSHARPSVFVAFAITMFKICIVFALAAVAAARLSLIETGKKGCVYSSADDIPVGHLGGAVCADGHNDDVACIKGKCVRTCSKSCNVYSRRWKTSNNGNDEESTFNTAAYTEKCVQSRSHTDAAGIVYQSHC